MKYGDAFYFLGPVSVDTYTSSKKFHLPMCSGAVSIKEENRDLFEGTRSELIAMGYSPCGTCKP